MSRGCTVCDHEQRERIDQELAAGTPNRRIAREYGPTEQAIRRHLANHVSLNVTNGVATNGTVSALNKSEQEHGMTVNDSTRTAEQIHEELQHVNRQLVQVQKDLDAAHRRRQEIDAELVNTAGELARLDAEHLTARGDYTAQIDDLQRRQRELRIEREDTAALHAHKAAVLANVQRIRDRLAAEYAPFERELLIQRLGQVRAELVATYRRAAELHNEGVNGQHRLQAIDREIGPRDTPYEYRGDRYTLGALSFPNPQIAAAHYERGGRPQAAPLRQQQQDGPIAVMG